MAGGPPTPRGALTIDMPPLFLPPCVTPTPSLDPPLRYSPHLIRDHPSVDPHDAILESLRHTPRARQVFGEKVGGKPGRSVVGGGDGFGFGVEDEDGGQGAKGLLRGREGRGFLCLEWRACCGT